MTAIGSRETRSRCRSGAITLWVILAIPAAITLLALVTEVANIWLARIELEDALEAAALAGVKTWSELSMENTPTDPHVNPDDPVILARVRLATQALGAENTIVGETLNLDLNDGGPAAVHGNASINGDILLGGFPDNAPSGPFYQSGNVGCGRTEEVVQEISLLVSVVVNTTGGDTSNRDNVFRIAISNDSDPGATPFTGSITKLQLNLRNPNSQTIPNPRLEKIDPSGGNNAGNLTSPDGVFDPDGNGLTDEEGFGPVVGSDSDVAASTVSFDSSQAANGLLTINIQQGYWVVADMAPGDGIGPVLTFGIDTDGVGDGTPANSPTDLGADFGDPGSASGKPGRVSLQFGVNGTDLLTGFPIESLQPNGTHIADLQGNAVHLQGTFTWTIVIPNTDYAVLTQKTVEVRGVCRELFGVGLGPFHASARATATARCRNQSSTDPEVLKPRLVHTTEIIP